MNLCRYLRLSLAAALLAPLACQQQASEGAATAPVVASGE